MLADVDVILFYPKTGVDLGATIAPPHGLLALAAPLLHKGYKVRIIDQRVDTFWRSNLIESLKKNPVCVGISSMTGTQIFFALQAAKIVREFTNGRVPIVWGGAHPSSLPEQTVNSEDVDIVVVGEGDDTFVELVDAIAGHRLLKDVQGIVFKDAGAVIKTPSRPLLDVENLLPTPWELLDIEKYIHRDFYLKNTFRSMDIGQTSRGCPFLCGFCSSASLRQRRWRAMSVRKSLENILEPVRRFKLDSIWIRDDEFYISPERVNGICEGIINSGIKLRWYSSGTRVDVFNRSSRDLIEIIKRSGADTLKLGAESGSDRILKLMNKGICRADTLKANLKAKSHGITPVYALIVGFPTETFDDINQTIDLFVQLRKENPQAQFELIGAYTALPQTPLYDLAIKHGLKPPERLEDWVDWLSDDYDLTGQKLPWYTPQQREYIGNITYMSLLANASGNAINSIGNPLLRNFLKFFISPTSHFERFKLIRHWYQFAPEMTLIRYLRRVIFYSKQ
ncbi:MAG: B12-binding domain-containing radical SAM protein [Candidatus Omnitrophica bacterium]|nr:B12-binding domain-containing radical SAM protein [Candidatus Omnitrophota bacterium]